MAKSCQAKLVVLSHKVYKRLLALYPMQYRQEYETPMEQLFRDQCRDAWNEARAWGLALVWLRLWLDLIKSLILEHLRNLKRRKSMFNKTSLAFRKTFLVLFGAVFAVVFGGSFLMAYLPTEQYASTARIKVERTATDLTSEGYQTSSVGNYDPYFIQSQFELIQSDRVLGRVVKKLNLAESWGGTSGRAALGEADAIKLLKQHVELRPVRTTSLIEVRVYSKNPREASNIANKLTETYREFNSEQRRTTAGVETLTKPAVEIVDPAVAGLRPIRPNKPFTLFLGLFGGVLLALLVAVLGVFLVHLKQRLSRPRASTT